MECFSGVIQNDWRQGCAVRILISQPVTPHQIGLVQTAIENADGFQAPDGLNAKKRSETDGDITALVWRGFKGEVSTS